MVGLFLLTTVAVLGTWELHSVRVHGNHSIPDGEVIRLAGISEGQSLTDSELEDIRRRLLDSGRFARVEVKKRYLSLEESGPVALVIMVHEKEVVFKKFMFAPILELTDEYGFTYGARVTWVEPLGMGDRISFPLSWGGHKQAAVESTFDFGTTRKMPQQMFFSFGWHRRENPHYELDDERVAVRGGWNTRLRWLTMGVSAGWSDISFNGTDDRLITVGAGAALDTRHDSNLPVDAVYLGYHWERLEPDLTDGVNRHTIDLRGYKHLVGPGILAAQFLYDLADGPLPEYERPFLGGGATLRGHSAGRYIGDNRLIGSLELRWPLSRPMAWYRYGLNVFVDTGAAYDYGNNLGDARFRYGTGVGFWIFAAMIGFKVEAGYDFDESVKIHFSTGFRF
jgi:outer membrane protein assembly factor BamA